MAKRDVVVVGASAGGVEALKELVAGLPGAFPAAILVVLHVPSTGSGLLPDVLDRIGPLGVQPAADGDELRTGRMLVAPPGVHLLVADSRVTLSRGPRENGHRPAIDVLFRSAATELGSRVVGVVLSGALDDGAAGMVAVRRRGGIGVVQDPDDAQHPSMPRAALEATAVEHVLPAAKIPGVLERLVGLEVPDSSTPAPPLMEAETNMADQYSEIARDPGNDSPGTPSELTCPDCHGPLLQITEGDLTRFRCRVGHAWSPRSLAAQQSTSVENALWTAMETLEEKASLREELGRRATARGHHLTAKSFRAAAIQAREAATQIRDLINGSITAPEESLRDDFDEWPGILDGPPA